MARERDEILRDCLDGRLDVASDEVQGLFAKLEDEQVAAEIAALEARSLGAGAGE